MESQHPHVPTAVGTYPNPVDTAEELSPRLPREIECKIFMLAFWAERKDVTKLLCVADRVRHWLIPLIYDVITIDFRVKLDQMLPLLEQHGHHVHHLLLACIVGDSQQSRIFEACPNIWDLAYWCREVISLSVYGSTGLKRIAIKDLDRARLDTTGTDPLISPSNMNWFSNITHIIALDARTPKSAEIFPQFPNLTHFMLVSSTPFRVFQYILHSLPKLKVMVWLLNHVSDEEKIFAVDSSSDVVPKVDDERIVTINGRLSSAWVKAAKGEVEHDMWALAEKTLETRRLKSPR